MIPKPDVTQLSQDVATALQQRPELVRFQLLRQRLGVDLQLALNDIFPTLNATSNIAQDIGAGSRTLDRTNYQAGVVFALPVARRDALGRTGAAQAQIVQTLLSERDAQDRIVAEVQDAISELNAAYARVETNRKALEEAIKVRDLEEQRFGRDLNNILQLNIQEVLAVQAENGVVDALADFLRAVALYQTALGIEANPELAGQTVTTPRPIGQLPEVNRDPKDFPFNRPEPDPGPGQKLPAPRPNPPVEVPPLPNPKQP
jgi:outer membrane protein TolC